MEDMQLDMEIIDEKDFEEFINSGSINGKAVDKFKYSKWFKEFIKKRAGDKPTEEQMIKAYELANKISLTACQRLGIHENDYLINGALNKKNLTKFLESVVSLEKMTDATKKRIDIIFEETNDDKKSSDDNKDKTKKEKKKEKKSESKDETKLTREKKLELAIEAMNALESKMQNRNENDTEQDLKNAERLLEDIKKRLILLGYKENEISDERSKRAQREKEELEKKERQKRDIAEKELERKLEFKYYFNRYWMTRGFIEADAQKKKWHFELGLGNKKENLEVEAKVESNGSNKIKRLGLAFGIKINENDLREAIRNISLSDNPKIAYASFYKLLVVDFTKDIEVQDIPEFVTALEDCLKDVKFEETFEAKAGEKLFGTAYSFGGMTKPELKSFIRGIIENKCDLTKQAIQIIKSKHENLNFEEMAPELRQELNDNLANVPNIDPEVQMSFIRNSVANYHALNNIHSNRSFGYMFKHPLDYFREGQLLDEIRHTIENIANDNAANPEIREFTRNALENSMVLMPEANQAMQKVSHIDDYFNQNVNVDEMINGRISNVRTTNVIDNAELNHDNNLDVIAEIDNLGPLLNDELEAENDAPSLSRSPYQDNNDNDNK